MVHFAFDKVKYNTFKIFFQNVGFIAWNAWKGRHLVSDVDFVKRIDQFIRESSKV